jgi:hypothetical protein
MLSGFFMLGDNPPARFTRNNFTWGDDVRWTRGSHNLSFGGDFEASRVDIENLFHQPGQFQFTPDITSYSVASFMLGHMHFFQQGYGESRTTGTSYRACMLRTAIVLPEGSRSITASAGNRSRLGRKFAIASSSSGRKRFAPEQYRRFMSMRLPAYSLWEMPEFPAGG